MSELETEICKRINYIDRMIEEHKKIIEKKKVEIKSNEIAIENYSNMKKLFEGYLEKIKESEEKKEKAEVKAPVKERVTRFKNAHIGCFDEKGNQLSIWITQKAAAKALFMTPSNVCQIMKKDKEHQLKKRGYYLAWVY